MSLTFLTDMWTGDVAVALGIATLVIIILCWMLRLRASRWKSEANRYRNVLEAVSSPVLVLDSELRILEGNLSARRDLEIGRRAPGNRSIFDVLESDAAARDVARRLDETGEATMEATLGTPARRHAVVRLRRMEFDGRRRSVALVEDVTEARDQTARYESFIDHLIRHVPAEVAIVSSEGHYLYLSSAFITDESQRAWLLGKTDFDYCRHAGIHMEVALRRRAHRIEALDRRETVLFEETVESGGLKRRLAWRYCPFIDPADDLALIVGFGLDVTDLARTRDALQRAEEEAGRAVKLKDALLQNVTHEIRTPLSSIIATAQMLRSDVPEPVREFLESITQSGRRLAETLNEMIELAGLQAEGVDVRTEIVNLTDEVAEVARLARPDAERSGLFLSASDGDAEILVRADRGALHRCLRNLVDNAIKFTTEGGILLEAAVGREYAYVRVMDSGVGIGEDTQEEVFDAFRQEEDGLDRSFEGVGLGLAVTRRLLTMMDGDVRVHSRKGSGSSFVVRLPLVVPEIRRRGKARVLVADPHRETHRLVGHMLGELFEFASAYSLSEALSLAGSERYEAVLVDGQIEPDVGPGELISAFRDAGGATLVLMDHQRVPGRRDQCLHAGWNGYVTKPLARLDLLNELCDRANREAA